MKIKGRFYFKKTQSGNLLGEFSNNDTLTNFTESADLVSNEKIESFEGTYNSSWQENGTPHFAKLKILKKSNSIYSLEWTKKKPPHNFGEGFLVDGMLIGNYRD
jgi:hypothetical protein